MSKQCLHSLHCLPVKKLVCTVCLCQKKWDASLYGLRRQILGFDHLLTAQHGNFGPHCQRLSGLVLKRESKFCLWVNPCFFHLAKHRPNPCGHHLGKINGHNSTYVKVWRCTFGRITRVLMGKSWGKLL